jgi:hypothetical protein
MHPLHLSSSTRRRLIALSIPCLFGALNGLAAFTTIINVPPDLGDGVTLANDTQLNITNGGSVGLFLGTSSGPDAGVNIEINLIDGSIGSAADFFGDVTVNISGGVIADFFADNGVTLNVSGGVIGTDISGISGFGSASVMNFSGGQLGDFFDVNPGATLNVSGGTLGAKLEVFGDTFEFDPFDAAGAPGQLNLFGTGFSIDGVPLDFLTDNIAHTVTERGGALLAGVLADGTPFSLDLNDDATGSGLESVFYTNAVLTVTQVPEPAHAVLASAVIGLGLVLLRRLRIS